MAASALKACAVRKRTACASLAPVTDMKESRAAACEADSAGALLVLAFLEAMASCSGRLKEGTLSLPPA